MHTALCLFSLALIVLCQDVDLEPKIRYYYGTIDKFTELPLVEADRIFLFPWYNGSRPTVIFAHGFTGRPDGPAVTAVINSYLEQDESNVMLLNWDYFAAALQPSLANSYINWAAPNARKLGTRFADTLLSMSSAGLDLNKTHLVGHSLGAQIFGIAGNRLYEKAIRLPWITGLDPAGVGFEGRPLPSRLNAFSAEYVDVIHSDPNKYGFSRAMGTVDFWPNYRTGAPVRQPGCNSGPQPMFSPADLCSHNRCWQLLVDAIRYQGSVLGSHARNYRIWKNYSKKDRNAVVLEIGKLHKNSVPGNYYFVTKADTPYGLGRNGL